MKTTLIINETGVVNGLVDDEAARCCAIFSSHHYVRHSGTANTLCDRCQSLPKTLSQSCWLLCSIIIGQLYLIMKMLNQIPKYIMRSLMLASLVLLGVCLQADQLVATGQVVHDCKSTPSLRDGKLFVYYFKN